MASAPEACASRVIVTRLGPSRLTVTKVASVVVSPESAALNVTAAQEASSTSRRAAARVSTFVHCVLRVCFAVKIRNAIARQINSQHMMRGERNCLAVMKKDKLNLQSSEEMK